MRTLTRRIPAKNPCLDLAVVARVRHVLGAYILSVGVNPHPPHPAKNPGLKLSLTVVTIGESSSSVSLNDSLVCGGGGG